MVMDRDNGDALGVSRIMDTESNGRSATKGGG